MKLTLRHFFSLLLCLFVAFQVSAQRWPRYAKMRTTNKEFYKTDEARQIGEQILAFQRVTGGWPKNIDMAKPLTKEELAKVLKDKQRIDDSTIDNSATTMQMRYLARLFQTTGDKRYSDAFGKAIEYLLSGQYEDGGWPQFWPETQGYQFHITYNDDAIVNILNLFQEIIKAEYPYNGTLTSKKVRKKLETSVAKAIECILATQIVANGELTIW